MKKEIMRILALSREDFHGRKRYSYYILYFSVIILQTHVILYLEERLSFVTLFLVIVAYISVLVVLILATRKIRSMLHKSDEGIADGG
ncbi:MAG: hypothetical protein HXS44_02080 [Theionarchaea archaeon]|nr:hypothetical protein [Theionarchaea archaeon]